MLANLQQQQIDDERKSEETIQQKNKEFERVREEERRVIAEMKAIVAECQRTYEAELTQLEQERANLDEKSHG